MELGSSALCSIGKQPGHKQRPAKIEYRRDDMGGVPVAGKPGKLEVGQPAPDFSLNDHNGKSVKLSALRGKIVVLFFYPKDDSPSCTREACSFRDQYADFRDAGAEVLGVNGESSGTHSAFAGRQSLNYSLLTDTGNAVQKAYGVPAMLGLFTSRVTFVIDREGIVRHIVSDPGSQRHVREALETVKRLAA